MEAVTEQVSQASLGDFAVTLCVKACKGIVQELVMQLYPQSHAFWLIAEGAQYFRSTKTTPQSTNQPEACHLGTDCQHQPTVYI
eukprot:1711787-Amphidinium_carterae.3